mmetsp:Transcript_11861/g.13482  ORF Transcript_11861/g.13482 Transcript_11861/m.13482 type:complete len:208 (-) Transcript_11861:573-1196(-)
MNIYCVDSNGRDSFNPDGKLISKIFRSSIFSEEREFNCTETECLDKYYYEIDEPVLKSSTFFKYFKAQDTKEKVFLLKKFEIDQELIKDNVKFYKDFLFSTYLKHKHVLSPIKVYTKPEIAILYKNLEGGSLTNIFNMRVNGYKMNDEIVPPSHFEFSEALEIIKCLLKAIKHCHHFGVLVKTISMDTIGFLRKEKFDSLKIFDFCH